MNVSQKYYAKCKSPATYTTHYVILFSDILEKESIETESSHWLPRVVVMGKGLTAKEHGIYGEVMQMFSILIVMLVT